jgi:predicted dehydrogenase
LAPAAIAEDVVPGLHESQLNELVAVASRDGDRAQRFADKHQIPEAVTGYQRLLDREDIDCVYICVPNSEHATWIRAALNSGMHVLAEKPLTPTADEADELFSLAVDRGLQLAEAFMYRYHPKTHRLGELVRSGTIGEVHEIRSWFNYWALDPATDIRFRPELNGGALYDVGCYCVSVSNYLTDSEPVGGHGFAKISPHGVDERFAGVLHYPSGAIAQFHCSMRSPVSLGVTVLGELGEIHVPMPWYAHKAPHTISVTFRDGRNQELEADAVSAYAYETEAMAQAVLQGRPMDVTGSETTRTLRTIELLQRNTTNH